MEKTETIPSIQQEQTQQSILLEETEQTISKMVQEKISTAKGTTHRKMATLQRDIKILKEEVEQRWKHWEVEISKWKQQLEPSQQQQDTKRFDLVMDSNRNLENLLRSLQEKSISLEKDVQAWKAEIEEQFRTILSSPVFKNKSPNFLPRFPKN